MATTTINSWEDFLEVKDLRSFMKLCDQFKVNRKGITSVDDARDALIKGWEVQHGSIKLTESQKLSGIKSALTKTRDTNQKLAEKYKSCSKLYKKLHPRIQKSIVSVFPGVEKVFKEKISELERGECTIVVAGEVGAGKSSLINLLLGDELLPTNALKCSNTICELRTCPEGQEKVIVHLRETMGENGKMVTHPPELKRLNREELKEMISKSDSDYEENPYDKIEIYFPFPMLPEGVVFIDTPGIEGGSDVVKRLEKYLSTAFGFIYVVNTNTAGGVQQGRLQRLLNMVVNSSDDFTPEASMFVCNKWEQVPDSDKRAVQADILTKLQKVYPGVQEHQIHYMSVKKVLCGGQFPQLEELIVHEIEPANLNLATDNYVSWDSNKSSDIKVITIMVESCSRMNLASADVERRYSARISQHRELLRRIEEFIPNCLCQGLNVQYTWLSNFLKRTMYFLKVSSASESKSGEKIHEQYKSLKQQMEKLKRDADVKIKDLRNKIDYELHRTRQGIKELLLSRKALESLCQWKPQECPGSTKWKRLVEDSACVIAERVSAFINTWEKETRVLDRIDSEIVRVFAEEFGLVEHQVKELEDELLKHRGLGQMFHTIKVVPVKSLFKAKKKNVQKAYNTIGGAVSNIGSLSPSDKETRKLFKKEYDKKKAEIMSEATLLFIKSIVEHRDFDGKLNKFFNRFTADIDTAAKRIPSFIEADEQMIENLNAKMGDSERVKEQFPVLISDSNELLAQLDIFYINSIMRWDFVIGDRGDIEYGTSEKDKLGTGAFADVYKGVIKSKKRGVALKVFKLSVTKETVTDVLTEDRIMRDLNHVNIVRYYGASYIPTDKALKWVMVMELCSSSLKSIYIRSSGESAAPGKFPEEDPRREKAMTQMARHALQITTGLSYIHKKGYAHRDLKMENILIGTDGKVKLADVGVAKSVNIIAMTCVGSPAYMAPEVLLANRNHDSKADIYSLAYIEYEMWYGRDLSDIIMEAITSNDAGVCSDAIALLKKDQEKGDNSYRPSFALLHRPPPHWIELIRTSWDHVPEKRLSAAKHADFFSQELRRGQN